MNLERVIAALAPTDVVQRAPVEISDLAYDTRAVGPGALFFCVPGERRDGHAFAREAVESGAVALVVERVLELDVSQLVVEDARSAMAQAAVVFFDDPTRTLEVAGVTGTNGKTTTTFLLHSILGAAGRRPGLLGTIESLIGGERRPAIRTTPEAIDLQRAFREMLDAADRSCASSTATARGCGPAGSSCGRSCAAASTSRTCSRPSPSRGCSASRTTRSQPGSQRSRAFPAGSRRSRRVSRSRSLSITPTSRTRWRTCSGPPVSLRVVGSSASSVAAATGTGASAR